MLIPTIFNDFKNCIPKKGIIHIGACKCEEKPIYNSIGINDDNILWIEAINEIVDEVKINDNNINIIQSVISDKDDEDVNFMITNNLQSSSILNFKTHSIEHPGVIETQRRMLKTITLNTLYDKNNISYDKYDFINLDIQGAELKALQGASKILPYINAIYCEVNERELYENCGLLPELDNFLLTYDFKRVITHMTPYGWGDALYLKK